MAGFLGLFGKKDNNGQTPENGNGKAFFLDADQAKTLGNIEYMRTPKAVRRTFPGTATNGGEFEQVKIVSAMGEVNTPEGVQTVPSEMMNGFTAKPADTASQNGQGESDRRSTDSSMDMFRNMARSLKKQ